MARKITTERSIMSGQKLNLLQANRLTRGYFNTSEQISPDLGVMRYTVFATIKVVQMTQARK
jgi:hypothetical protein